MGDDGPAGVRLVRADDRAAAIEKLREAVGQPAGLSAVLEDLNRTATSADVPGPAARWGFRWDPGDEATERWYPQGISTSADREDSEQVHGRRVVCVSWYAKRSRFARSRGSRLSFVDVTDEERLRYRHVLLVEPVLGWLGRVSLRPVRVHAGGVVWHGPYVYVAATRRGVHVFRIEDIMRVPDGSRTGLRVRRGRVDAFGYRYVLPLLFTYRGEHDAVVDQFRYSFLSLDRTTTPHQLVAGEYGKGGMSTRLVRFRLDPETSLLVDEDGGSRPTGPEADGVRHMQGATVVHGTWYLTSSAGPEGYGSLWVGEPGNLRRHARVLPPGPEDLTYWPSTDRLWSHTEYPGRRYVYWIARADLT